MTKTYYILNQLWQKHSHFVRNLNVFERRKRNGKKTQEFKWFIDENKYLKEEEVEKLLSAAEKKKEKAEKKGKKVAVRDYFVIKIGLSTGLRVQELILNP